MYQLSQTMQTALAAHNPERCLIEFTHRPDGSAYNPTVQFSNEDIVISEGIELNEEFNPETDLKIGLCPSAEITFTLLNEGNSLANFEFGTFKAYLGVRIDNGTPAAGAKTKTFTERGASALYEFAPLGTFISGRPDVVMQKMISVEAHDQMTLFDVDMPKRAALNISYPITVANLAAAMCAYAGVALKTNSWLNSTLSITAEPEQFENATMREVIGWIAEAGCSNARFSRDGTLEFAWFNPVNKTYTEHDCKEFTPAWYQTKAVNELHIRNENSTTEFIWPQAGGDNAYLIQNNPILRQAD